MADKTSKPRGADQVKPVDLNLKTVSAGGAPQQQPRADDYYRTYIGHEPDALRLFATAMRGGGAGAGAGGSLSMGSSRSKGAASSKGAGSAYR